MIHLWKFILMINISNKKLKQNKIAKIHNGIKHLFCKFVCLLLFCLIIVYFSNHLSGQDILHVIVYDEDSVVNEKIGSIQIDLNDLYEKGLLDDILLCNSI